VNAAGYFEVFVAGPATETQPTAAGGSDVAFIPWCPSDLTRRRRQPIVRFSQPRANAKDLRHHRIDIDVLMRQEDIDADYSPDILCSGVIPPVGYGNHSAERL
jgi:hypothetical protein